MSELEKLKEQIKLLEKEKNHLQFIIDNLMMEYCPDDMTTEQVQNWEAHQQVSKH